MKHKRCSKICEKLPKKKKQKKIYANTQPFGGDDTFAIIISYCAVLTPLFRLTKHHRALTEKHFELESKFTYRKTITILSMSPKVMAATTLIFVRVDDDVFLYKCGQLEKCHYEVDRGVFIGNLNFIVCDYMQNGNPHEKPYICALHDSYKNLDIEAALDTLIQQKSLYAPANMRTEFTRTQHRYGIVYGKTDRYKRVNHPYDDNGFGSSKWGWGRTFAIAYERTTQMYVNGLQVGEPAIKHKIFKTMEHEPTTLPLEYNFAKEDNKEEKNMYITFEDVIENLNKLE